MIFCPVEKGIEQNALVSVAVLIDNWNSGELLAECLVIKGISVMWRKRKEIQANRQASALDIWRCWISGYCRHPKVINIADGR